MSNAYTIHGYRDREDYLRSLADEYCVEYDMVRMLAEVFGESEDFDGLIVALEDYQVV